jgi:SAM-dependent methyltransferase
MGSRSFTASEELAWWEARYKQYGFAGAHYLAPWRDRISHALRVAAMKRAIPTLRGKSILDYGCGPGLWYPVWRELEAREILGWDSSEEACKLAAKVGFKIDATSQADVVVSVTVWQHMMIAESPLDSLKRLLGRVRVGGSLVLLEYLPERVPSFQRESPHKKLLSWKEFQDVIQKVGIPLTRVVPVNVVDGAVFWRLGDSRLSAYLTKALEVLCLLTVRSACLYRVAVLRRES